MIHWPRAATLVADPGAHERTAMDLHEHGKPLRCWIGSHTWVTRTEAGARWQECGRCGKYSPRVALANRFPPSGTGESPGGV